MLFMVIEHFKRGDAEPVYRRFHEQGRLLPEGLLYKGSWTSARMDRCFQLMECADASLLAQWTARWEDLVDFEVIPVMTHESAADRFPGARGLGERAPGER